MKKMTSLSQILGPAASCLFVFLLWKLFALLYYRLSSPLRRLRGPEPTRLLYGNMVELLTQPIDSIEEWVKEYGSAIRLHGMFFSNLLLTLDTRAINHILTHPSDFQRSSYGRYSMSRLLGEGLVTVEGDEHHKQRRIMNPAFGPAQIRGLTDIFVTKATQLRDILLEEITKDPSATASGAQIDVLHWLGKLTLDIIGLAGFNYDFDALDPEGKPNELHDAFFSMLAALSSERKSAGILPLLHVFIPLLRSIPTETSRIIRADKQTVNRIGSKLLADAKMAAKASVAEKGEAEKNTFQGRDLFSLLVKANMSTDIPDNQRLSDESVVAQVTTVLGAGFDTTSTGLAWVLFSLSSHREVQAKLRKELLSVETETPSMDDLMALPYLDLVVRETLRLHAPVVTTPREALKDSELPVEKPYKDRYGVIHDTIKIRKGDAIAIPLLEMNTSEEIWGPDSREFKPERWDNIPEAASQVPGLYSHLMSFMGGHRACIGYRFALVEMKAILFTLVRAFEFELAVPAKEVGRSVIIVTYPVLRSDPTRTRQLPLLVKPYRRS